MSARVHAATVCFWLTIAVILVIDVRLVVSHLVTACGGLDSAGYVGSARLLLSGHLTQYEPIARVLPFPSATAVAAPLGFVASGQPDFISPRFPPGLPLLMAVALAAGGRVGPFLVAPALAIATVWLVFRLARRTGDPVTAGLAAAITAITPMFVTMAMQPMSDVPATFWVVLTGTLLWRPRPRAPLAALAAGMAILTRPPLLLAALALGATTRWESRRQALTFAAIVAATTVLFVALQRHLYGNPLASGYGTAGQLFALSALPHNLRFYGGWLLTICTPVLPLVFAIGAVAEPRLAVRAGAVFLAVSAPYLLYAPAFEDWEILRFLLPGMPFVFVVCATGIVAIGRPRDHPAAASLVAAIAAIVLAAGSYAFLQRRHMFDVAAQEQRYPVVGEWFATHTSPRAVAISSLHSGSLRIYAGRPTLRAELLPDGSLVDTVRALETAGYVPYLALEQGEEYEEFDRRFHPFSDAALDVVPEGRARGVAFLRLTSRPARR
jgi:4-amino-4-deoxy-L-arabinose transferase-like glycosyltransferase